MNYQLRKSRYLLLIEEPEQKKELYLENKVYSVGRHSRNDIVLYSTCVSRHHATFLKVKYSQSEQDEVFWIIDGDLKGNRSTNGIMVNGKRCLSHELKHGDIITLAKQVVIKYDQINNYQQVNPENQKIPTDKQLPQLQDNRTTIMVTGNVLDESYQDFFNKLSDCSKCVPHPIIEVNYQGELIYINSIARVKIPSLREFTITHPIINELLGNLEEHQESFLIREITIEGDSFQEYVHYLPAQQIIRIYLFDFTKQKQIESALQASEAKYKAIVSQISEGIFLVDLQDRKIIDCNQAYCQLLKYTQEELLALTIYDILPIDDEIIDSYLDKIIAKQQELIVEGCHCSKDNQLIDVEVSISLIKYGEQEALCFAVRDIRERKKNEKLLIKQAYYDHLTGLANRTFFNQKLEQALEIAEKFQQQLALLFFDLDHFKKINDSLGHALGDKLLRSFARRVLLSLSPQQTFARWGGDEFILLIPNIKSIETVVDTVEKIVESLENPFSIQGQKLHVRVSIGIACYPQDGRDKETLLSNVDAVLYRIKQRGRNYYEFYNAEINSQASELLILENLLYQALEKDELFLNYQPQFNLKNNQILGVECLLRWHNPDLGLIPTFKFIQIAEETGLINSIGMWVLRKACEQYVEWQRMEIAPEYIAVNLSPRQLQQDNLLKNIQNILEETGLKPQCLSLEITESFLIADADSASEVLLALVDMGINITLDDFGTGYASLAYLKKFPFTTLKIDRSFVKDITESQQNLALVSAIISLAKALNLTVVAEGIETKEQLQLLKDLNCQGIQGYYYSYPLGARETDDFLRLYSQNSQIVDS